MVLKKLFHWGFLCLFLVPFTCYDSNISNRSHLIYWSSNNPDEIEFAQWVVNKWNSRYPEKQVRFQPVPEGRSSEEVILAAVVGKTTPDVYSNMWPGDVEFYVRANTLMPLDQFTDFDSVAASRFSQDKIEEAKSRDGHTYQILWKTNPIMMAYNPKLFREAGFPNPPKTYAEFLQAAEKLTKDSDNDGYTDRWVGITQILVAWWQRFFDYYTLYIAASGGNTLLDGTKVNFYNQHSIEVFRFLQTLFTKGYFPKERMDARTDVFMHSVVATRFVGPWTITQWERQKPNGFEYDFAPVPRPTANGQTYTYGDYKSIIMFNNTKHPEKAWEFVKFLISKESDRKLLELADQLPIRKGILEDGLFKPYFEKKPKMITFAHQSQYVRGADSSPVLREIFDAISQEFEACVIYGTKSPEEAVASAARRAELIME